jgi:hypothetical protein
MLRETRSGRDDFEAEFLEPADALLCGASFVAGAVVVFTEIMEGVCLVIMQ